MPRSHEQQFAGVESDSSLWPLIAGLPIEDLAPTVVLDAARAVAILHGLEEQELASAAVASRALEELEEQDVPSWMGSALVGGGGTPRGYETLMSVHPDSALRRIYRRRLGIPSR